MFRMKTFKAQAGVGLRLPHLREAATHAPEGCWFEIHPENFLANPHARELLQQIAAAHPVSVHSVGLSIGSASGVDQAHLRQVKQLVDAIDPVFVSGHLAWSMHEALYLNDLLPLPYDKQTLAIAAANIDRVQQALGRPYLVENPANYSRFGDGMDEPEFLAALVDATGCRLLCDISNIVVSATNLGFDALRYFDALPTAAIAQLHLGGYTEEVEQATGETLLIDSHAAPIAAPAWSLHAHALRRCGPLPTLIEWDNALPPFATLLAQMQHAETMLRNCHGEAASHASLA